MKITQIMLAKGFGGAERHFVDLSLALADKGYQVQAICHSSFAKQAELAKHPHITVQPIPVFATWDPYARYKVKQLIALFRPAVIHAHLARAAFIGGKAAHALAVPAVVNLHNYIDLKYYRDIAVFIPATEDQKNYLLSHGIPAEKITRMPHFSPLPTQAAQPLPTDRPLRFVTLGRMVQKKGFDVLLRAFKNYLGQAGAGQLIIGGDGAERDALKQLTAELKLQNNVTFPGWVEDAASFLAQGDVFVLPSLDEPFGIVVLEAMASGRPIISTRTKGPITIVDEQCAYFAEIGDVPTLAQAMLDVRAQPEVAIKKAQLATALYQSTYSTNAVVPQVEAIYQRLTSGMRN
jgi:glycosyltransferase involved in cell wall biosynthesis